MLQRTHFCLFANIDNFRQVKLMNEMKEEAQKKRTLEAKHSKEAAKHKKEQRLMEVKMKRLEADKRQKDLVLKRKMEEVRFFLICQIKIKVS